MESAGLVLRENRERFYSQLVDRLSDGESVDEIAFRLYPGNTRHDKIKRRRFRERVFKYTAEDPTLQLALTTASKAEMWLALPAVTHALIRRAVRGRPDAIKLLFEASGFHNPRVKHEHSGDINIKLSIPRPTPVDIPEADVVEE